MENTITSAAEKHQKTNELHKFYINYITNCNTARRICQAYLHLQQVSWAYLHLQQVSW